MKKSERYPINVQYDQEEGEYIATCLQFPRLSGFGETRDEAISILQESIELGLELLTQDGRPAPEPDCFCEYSGKINLRLPKTVHSQLAQEAKREGVSLNQLMVSKLSGEKSNPSNEMLAEVLSIVKSMEEQQSKNSKSLSTLSVRNEKQHEEIGHKIGVSGVAENKKIKTEISLENNYEFNKMFYAYTGEFK